ncbi:MAG: DUF2071 domain-containing protein [Actinomycetes bacterium]
MIRAAEVLQAKKAEVALSVANIPIMRQTWSNIIWCHWPVEPSQVAAILPEGLEPDLYEGEAWVGLIPFSMHNLRFPGPFSVLTKLLRVSSFGEVNVRTYVIGPDGKSGVWFCTLDSDDWLAVKTANIAFGLPYRFATTRFEQTHAIMNWTSQRKGDLARAELVIRKTSESSRDALPGLEQFLVERYALYTLRRGKLFRGRLKHAKWKVKSASLERVVHETVNSEGISVVSGAHILIGEPVEVTVYPLTRVR